MRDKQSTNTLLLTVGGLLVLGTSTFTVIANKEHAVAPGNPTAHAVAGSHVTVASSLAYSGATGKTVLQLLKTKAAVATTDTANATVIQSINGVANGTDNKHWHLYINGSPADVNITTYATNTGDHIEWKFE